MLGLGSVSTPEFFPGCEGGWVACLSTPALGFIGFTAHRVSEWDQVGSPGKRQFNRFKQVEVGIHRAGAVIPDHGVFQATDWGIFVHVVLIDQVLDPGFLGFQEHTRHRTFIEVDQEGCSLAIRDHINNPVQQIIRRAAMQADVWLWFQDRAHIINHIQDDMGQVIGHISAISPDAGEGQQLPIASGDALVATGADHAIVGSIGVYPETFEDILAKFGIHTLCNRFLPEGVEVLVDAPEGHTGTGIILIRHHQHMGQPQGLHSLPEVLRWVPGNGSQVLCHLHQFIPASRIIFRFG